MSVVIPQHRRARLGVAMALMRLAIGYRDTGPQTTVPSDIELLNLISGKTLRLQEIDDDHS